MKLYLGVAAMVLLTGSVSYGQTIILDPQTGTLQWILPSGTGDRATEQAAQAYRELQTHETLESIDRSLKALAEEKRTSDKTPLDRYIEEEYRKLYEDKRR